MILIYKRTEHRCSCQIQCQTHRQNHHPMVDSCYKWMQHGYRHRTNDSSLCWLHERQQMTGVHLPWLLLYFTFLSVAVFWNHRWRGKTIKIKIIKTIPFGTSENSFSLSLVSTMQWHHNDSWPYTNHITHPNSLSYCCFVITVAVDWTTYYWVHAVRIFYAVSF